MSDNNSEQQGLMDTRGYHDVKGEFISLRDAPTGLATGVTGVADSGDVTLFNTKTNQHHTIVKGTGVESDSQSFIDQHNSMIRSNVIVEDRPQSSLDELAQQVVNKARRAKEIEDGSNIWSAN